MRNLIIGFFFGLTVSVATAQVYPKVDAAGKVDLIPTAQVFSHVDGTGVLKDYIVEKDGIEICRDPEVYVQFRGPNSYIVCP